MTSKRKIIEKYWEVFKVNFTNSTTYMTNLLARSVTVVFRTWIFTQLYRATFQVSHAVIINNVTVPMVIWILMLTQGFQSSTRPSLIRQIDEDVKTGTLAYSLNRPYSYLLFNYFGYLGRAIPALFSNVLIGVISVVILVNFIPMNIYGVISGILLLFFGLTLDFLISFCLGITAFWVEDTSAFVWIYSKSQLVLGGNIFPIALFPTWLRNLSQLLPFSQLFYSSAQTIVAFSPYLFVTFLGTQIAWIIIFTGIAITLFSRGGKYVSINGG